MSKRSATSTKPGKASKASASTPSTAPKTWGGTRDGAGSGGTRLGAGRPRTTTRYHLDVAPFFGIKSASPPPPSATSLPSWYVVLGGLVFEFPDEERAKAFASIDLASVVTRSLASAERLADARRPLVLSSAGRDMFRALASLLAEKRG